LLADRVAEVIARETAAKGRCVLGLATGSTPLGIYRELIRRHQAGEVDFSRVVTFNLDEYYPMPPDSPHSYRRYMWENLFAHVNIRPEQVHVPEDNVPREAITMGVATILDAREIALIATGEHKADIVARAVEGEVSPDVAATFLQRHGTATAYLDLAAAAELTRIKTPWVLSSVDWTPGLTER